MTAPHDPGGKTRLRLPDGVTGTAEFSECGRYRPALSRHWDHGKGAVLFVGLNPSVAGAEVSDPTCSRELSFAMGWGYAAYLKGNVMDWRATVPRDIPQDPEMARSSRNIPALQDMAHAAALIVMASGNVHPRFAQLLEETEVLLRASGKPIKCFGRNKGGAAKHPLYLRKDAELIDF